MLILSVCRLEVPWQLENPHFWLVKNGRQFPGRLERPQRIFCTISST